MKKGKPSPTQVKYLRLSAQVAAIERLPIDTARTEHGRCRINKLVDALEKVAGDGRRWASLHRRALEVQSWLDMTHRGNREQILAAQRRKKQLRVKASLPSNRLTSLGIERAGREVLGGLPGSRRQH